MNGGLHIWLQLISYYTEAMDELPFVEVEHTADWSLRVRAGDFAGLLRNAAMGMFKLMGMEMDGDLMGESLIEVSGEDRETLLVSWLEELLFQIETRSVALVLDRLSVSDERTHLAAQVSEFPLLRLEKEIKAVTYHGLRVIESDDGFEATVVFDV